MEVTRHRVRLDCTVDRVRHTIRCTIEALEADLSAHPDTFLNVNTPEERAALEARLRDA